MEHRDIIVVGASAGGVDALIQLAKGLPAGIPASLLVVCHFPPGARSILPEILSRSGPVLATHARDGERFQPGHIYVAPPDRHLQVGPDRKIVLSHGPRENFHRPAVDPLFRSAARYYGRRVIGVILSGSQYDGSAGLLAVRSAGGLAIVQDPKDAAVAAMPGNASQIAGADILVPAAELARVLVDQVHRPLGGRGSTAMEDPFDKMPGVVETTMSEQVRNGRRGKLSAFSCPECGGVMWQVDEERLAEFRCHVGHAYSGEALLAEQSEALEAALWTAVRTFREKEVLTRQLAAMERGRGNAAAAARMEEQAQQAADYGELIRRNLLNGPPQSPGAE